MYCLPLVVLSRQWSSDTLTVGLCHAVRYTARIRLRCLPGPRKPATWPFGTQDTGTCRAACLAGQHVSPNTVLCQCNHLSLLDGAACLLVLVHGPQSLKRTSVPAHLLGVGMGLSTCRMASLSAERMSCASAVGLPAALNALTFSVPQGFCLAADLDALAYLYYLSTVVNSLRQYYSSIQGICILLVIVKEMRVLSMQKRLSIITTTLVKVSMGVGGYSLCRPTCFAAHTSAVPASCSSLLMPSSQIAVLQVVGSRLAASTGVFAVWEPLFRSKPATACKSSSCRHAPVAASPTLTYSPAKPVLSS